MPLSFTSLLRWRRTVTVSLVTLVVNAVSLNALASEENLPESCNPLRTESCLLPFPTDFLTKADPESPTGIKLAVPDELVSLRLQEVLVDAYKPSNVFADKNGFSAAAPVLFQLIEDYDPETLPRNGGDSFIIFDMDADRRVPINTYLSKAATSLLQRNRKIVIEGIPRTRFEWGHKHIAVLTKNLKRYDGADLTPSAGVQTALSNDGSELSTAMEPYVTYLEEQGISRENILSLTHFTITDMESIVNPTLDAIDIVRSQEHPIRNLNVTYPWVGPIGAIVTGELRATNFRAEDGTVDFSEDYQGESNWISFRLTLPDQAKKGPVPIMIYGHGISVLKETDIVVSLSNVIKGIATISIDQPNHGSRSKKDGGYILFLMNPENSGLLTGMVNQSTLDFHSLLSAVLNELNTLDVLPNQKNPFQRNLYDSGIGTPDIDTEQIYYSGTSMGGVVGSTFVATAPEVKGAYLHVAGVGISNFLTHTSLFDLFRFSKLLPPEADGAEAAFGLGMLQYRADKTDAINFVQFLKNPPQHHLLKEKPVTVQYGIDDTVVFNAATFAYAEILDLPIIGQHKEELPYLKKASSTEAATGSGLHEIAQPIPGSGISSHFSFLTPRGYGLYFNWVDQVIKKCKWARTSNRKTAKAMLKEREYSITEISNAVGFTTLSSFNRQFKAVTNFSPSRWRQLNN